MQEDARVRYILAGSRLIAWRKERKGKMAGVGYVAAETKRQNRCVACRGVSFRRQKKEKFFPIERIRRALVFFYV